MSQSFHHHQQIERSHTQVTQSREWVRSLFPARWHILFQRRSYTDFTTAAAALTLWLLAFILFSSLFEERVHCSVLCTIVQLSRQLPAHTFSRSNFWAAFCSKTTKLSFTWQTICEDQVPCYRFPCDFMWWVRWSLPSWICCSCSRQCDSRTHIPLMWLQTMILIYMRLFLFLLIHSWWAIHPHPEYSNSNHKHK